MAHIGGGGGGAGYYVLTPAGVPHFANFLYHGNIAYLNADEVAGAESSGWITSGPYQTVAQALASEQGGSTGGNGSGGGGWYVIELPPGAHGVPGHLSVSQKPFPAGATEVSGPYATKAEALASANTAVPKGTAGSGVVHDITNPFGDFLGRLSQGSTWIRVGEVVLGLLLIAVGVAKLTHAVPIATKIASVVK